MNEDLKIKIENEDLELFSSQSLFDKQVQKIINKFDVEIELIVEDKKSKSKINREEIKSEVSSEIEELLEERLNNNDCNFEPYRTNIANINFILIDILTLLCKNDSMSTDLIYKLPTLKIEENITTYLHKQEAIRIQHLKNLLAKKTKLQDEKKSIASINKKIKVLEDKENQESIKAKDQIFYDSYADMSEEEEGKARRKKRDLIYKALKYLTSYNIIKKDNSTNYSLNLEHWFNFSKYSLHQKNLLEKMIPFLISFIKFNAPNKVDDFLKNMDDFLVDILQDPSRIPISSSIESKIIDAFQKKERITLKTIKQIDPVTLKSKAGKKYKDVEILQVILRNDGSKALKLKSAEDAEIKEEILIEEILQISSTADDENSVEVLNPSTGAVSHSNYNDKHKDLIKNPNYHKLKDDPREYDIIFKAAINQLEYFERKPIKGIEMFKSPEEQEDFCTTNGLRYNENSVYFYITAKDTKAEIFKVVKLCLPHVKIIDHEDYEFNKEFRDLLLGYIRNDEMV